MRENFFDDVKNIAIIGAGNLGSRHLQALALIDFPINIDVTDLSKESLKTAKKRWEEMPANDLIKQIQFVNSIDELSANLDVVIIATIAKIFCTKVNASKLSFLDSFSFLVIKNVAIGRNNGIKYLP